MDNNPMENAIRPFSVGQKNLLFSASVKGAKASANLYSLIETAKGERTGTVFLSQAIADRSAQRWKLPRRGSFIAIE